MALAYDDRTDRFRVYGTFCSFACVGGYARDNRGSIPGSSNGSIGMAIFDMYKRWTGRTDPATLRKAPPRCLLRAFGGTMTIDEFRAASGSSRGEVVRMPPRCILHEQVYHERVTSKAHMHVTPAWARGAPRQAAASSGGGETLKLKRKYQAAPEKPKTKRTILEQALGIA